MHGLAQTRRPRATCSYSKRNYVHVIATGHGGSSAVLATGGAATVVAGEVRTDVKVKDFDINIVQSAIARFPFFAFASLHRYFPHLTSMQEFISSDAYLGGLEVTFQGNLYLLGENRSEKLAAMIGLLSEIETEARKQITNYRGSREFKHDLVRDVFKNKVLKLNKRNPRAIDDPQFEAFLASKDWYAFNSLYGTSEEKPFVRMLDRQMTKLTEQYEDVYLVRNESHFKIYNFSDGQAFVPDFVLFLRQKGGDLLTYQLFIEPKGKYLKQHDRWKETFLKVITSYFAGKVLKLGDRSNYCLIGVPFYNNEDENAFKTSLWESIS